MYKLDGTDASEKVDQNALTETVRKFYEQFQFPRIRPPDQDGLILMRRLARQVSQHPPARESDQMRVLDAGCGTGNTSISLAHKFPDIEFLGLDISGPSLEFARATSLKDGLKNIRFRQWDLMKPIEDEQPFSMILCLGVLHHTANMQVALSNLHAVLKNDGELYLWVYGIHGRYKHSLNQRLLRMLLEVKPGSENEVQLAREFIHASQQSRGILNDLVGQNPIDGAMEKMLQDPAWIADQFLNPREVLLDMETLYELITASGFELSQWLGINPNISAHLGSSELVTRFNLLASHQQLTALDFLLKPDRYFIVIKKAQI